MTLLARYPDAAIPFQLGAREHYAVPRMLHAAGKLRALVTDAWAPPGSAACRLPGGLGRRLRERYHPALDKAQVVSFTQQLVAFEARQRLFPASSYWQACMQRNEWFERHSVAESRRRRLFANRPVVLAYSYAALGILRAALEAGCPTVLLQIDPAIMEERIVRRESARWERETGSPAPWTPPPAAYWHRWQEETRIADRIIVNSEWSRQALEHVGVDATKIRVVPLAYEPPAEALRYERHYPAAFTRERPLRVLFLGSLTLRKGIARVLDAIRQLREEPVVFRFVGAPEVDLPADLASSPQVEWLGSVPRGEVHAHYRWADVFLFPTLSDGFGLTQIEAASWGLPLIASKRCGEILSDGVEGIQLNTPTPEAIAGTIRRFLGGSVDLTQMATAARARAKDFHPSRISERLMSEVGEL